MLLEKLNWRYATKKMNPEKKVPEEKLQKILKPRGLRPPRAACSRSRSSS